MITLTKDQIRQMGLHNSYMIARAAGKNLFIEYVPAENGLAAHFAYWEVVGLGTKTDRQGNWYTGWNKRFTVYSREQKPTMLKDAMDWCHKKYGVLAFEKDPFGGYQVMGTLRSIVKNRTGKHTTTTNRENT